jgi:DNA transposition AAA+ family ATPase
MAFVTRSTEGEESGEKALLARLRQFVEDSDFSFYKIASSIGTSGGILSMWLAGTARPHTEELAAIEKTLGRRSHGREIVKELTDQSSGGKPSASP